MFNPNKNIIPWMTKLACTEDRTNSNATTLTPETRAHFREVADIIYDGNTELDGIDASVDDGLRFDINSTLINPGCNTCAKRGGRTALMDACAGGHITSARLLIQTFGAIPLRAIPPLKQGN